MGELPRRLVRRLPRGSKTPKSLIHIAVKEVVNSNVLLCGKLKELNRLGLFAFSVAAQAGHLNLATPTHKYAIRFSVFGSKNWEVSGFVICDFLLAAFSIVFLNFNGRKLLEREASTSLVSSIFMN